MCDGGPSILCFKVRKTLLAVNRPARAARGVLIACAAAVLLAALPAIACSQTSDRDAKFRLAQGLEQAGDYERAAALYGELLARDSANVVLLDAVQRVWMQLKRYDQVIALLARRIAREPRDAGLRATLGSVYYRANRERDAAAAWDAAIATDPSNPMTYRIVASVLAENRLLDRAAAVYRQGRAATGDENLFTLELAQLLSATMDYAGATAEYLRWLQANPAQIAFVQSRLAQITGRAEARASVAAVIRRALGAKQDLTLLRLLAWLDMEGKDFDDALELERTIDTQENAHGAELMQFAARAASDRAYAAASRGYQEALRAPLPGSRVPEAKFGYASAIASMQAAADTFGTPVRGTPATEAIPLYGGAVRLFREIIAAYPGTAEAARSWYAIGMLQSGKFGDMAGAATSFTHAMEEAGPAAALRLDAMLMLGKVATARGDTARAAALFGDVTRAAGATSDQHDEAVFRLAEIDYFGGRFDSAAARLAGITVNLKADYANDALRLQAFLQENASTAPDALRRYAAGDFLARQGKNTEAVAVFQGVISAYPGAPLVDDALMTVGALEAAAGLYAGAVTAYERLLTNFRSTSIDLDRAAFAQAEVYRFGLRDDAKARAAYERLLADFPKSLLADRARARLLELRGEAP